MTDDQTRNDPTDAAGTPKQPSLRGIVLAQLKELGGQLIPAGKSQVDDAFLSVRSGITYQLVEKDGQPMLIALTAETNLGGPNQEFPVDPTQGLNPETLDEIWGLEQAGMGCIGEDGPFPQERHTRRQDPNDPRTDQV